MSLKRFSNVSSKINIANLLRTKGDTEKLREGSDSDYVTVIRFVIPSNDNQIIGGDFEVNYRGSLILIKIAQYSDKSQDLIYNSILTLVTNTPWDGKIELSQDIISDNRGVYPCFYAMLVFPYRLKYWLDEIEEEKKKPNKNRDKINVLGPPPSEEKIIALTVLNKLFSSSSYEGKVRPISYEDVTALLLTYFRKGSSEPFSEVSLILTSLRAYRDAVKYLLNPEVEQSHALFLRDSELREINNESDLLKTVELFFTNVIKHEVEDRRLIQPFWDGKRKIKIEGKEVEIPAHPKKETDIQPTLHFILNMLLKPLKIITVREASEGVGNLDMKCLFTPDHGDTLTLPIEIKLAHNKGIKRGLINELPAYMRATKAGHGLFLVLWFKDQDEKYFKEPRETNITKMDEWLKTTAESVNSATGLIIEPIIIDTSIKLSASNL